MRCGDTSTQSPLAVSAAIVPLTATTTVVASSTSALTSASKQPTLMRIGSIGRTTIACVAPAVRGDDGEMNLLNNGSMGVISAAALAAAGVELESVDESMTEVLVKIENSSSSTQEEDEDMEAEADAEGEEEGDGDDDGEGEQQDSSDGKEPDFNYDLKLSSPMSWAFDTVKIENEEEFEDILSGGHDTTNTEDEDDLLTTAAATTKQAAVGSPNQVPSTSSEPSEQPVTQSVSSRCGNVLLKSSQRGATKRRTLADKRESIVPSKQQQQQLLEQQQHLQHLQLRPTQQTLQFKLASIPATITSFTATTTTSSETKRSSNGGNDQTCTDNTIGSGGSVEGGVASGGTETNAKLNSNSSSTTKNSDFKSSVSDDKRYRILVQNQRMRKESLEHSEDMIYNADIEKPWVCRNCNRNYKWKNSLKCHLKNECGQPPRYFCSKLCGYATNVHSNLKRHLNTKCRDRMDEDQKTNTSTYTLVFQQNE
ncbi:longitudinals lacking protein, isoforms J/P/Q/S/Z-like [Anastrepha obliqua]|uniref:longitudinals lacking protein, isoforms J/P/Q/S/Z-like n=1 Tax=Anastrepha obliqua TaxID=95512 RepID=UPI002408F2F3|nr:longitudinals lacking protein, isoforms J/P/Q/S/Z-like [Anastrepha obliqua]